MGYNLKMPWDLGELKKEGIPVFSPIVGSSSFVDLKLGRFGDPGEEFKVAWMDPSPSRKPRARGSTAQAASCLVDGCRSDLSTCRDYHRRHKVCEVHSKTAIVTIGGQERRFCQQCSRFHSLVEFDEGKRSCRKRLEGHNRRRRKPQPEAITLNPARFLSNHQGARYIPFGNPQVCGTGSVVGGSGWAGVGVVKAENDPILYNSTSTHSLISFADQKNGILSHNAYEGGKQFSFLQGTTSAAFPGDCTSQAFLDPNGGSSSQKMFGRAINSDRALSLLSSPPSKTREFGFRNVVQTSSSQLSNDVISTSYNNLRPQDTQAAGNVMGSNLNSHGMAMSGIDESSPHQTLYFSWE